MWIVPACCLTAGLYRGPVLSDGLSFGETAAAHNQKIAFLPKKWALLQNCNNFIMKYSSQETDYFALYQTDRPMLKTSVGAWSRSTACTSGLGSEEHNPELRALMRNTYHVSFLQRNTTLDNRN